MPTWSIVLGIVIVAVVLFFVFRTPSGSKPKSNDPWYPPDTKKDHSDKKGGK